MPALHRHTLPASLPMPAHDGRQWHSPWRLREPWHELAIHNPDLNSGLPAKDDGQVVSPEWLP